jgi:EmrB/QacA subfamily drug resistance transporter
MVGETDRKWWVLGAVGIGTLMSALDASVVNTMLPIISQSMSASVATIEWVVTAYLLVVSALLLGVGRAGDLHGHRTIYLAGFAVFVVSSALCGAAPSALTLIAFRALQGSGAAMLFASGPAILTASFPATERGRALGLQAMMTYIGLTVGPALGGWLTGQLGWRSIFLINVPIGVIAVALGGRVIPRTQPAQGSGRADPWGGVLFASGLTALLLAMNQGHTWGWSSAAVLGLLAAFVVLATLFIRFESRSESPMLDLALFRNRAFSAATVSAVLNYVSAYCIVFVLPFYLIRGRDFSPERAGLIMTAQSVVMVVVAPVSGALSDRIGPRLLSTTGMALMGGGLVLLARLGPTSALTSAILGLAVAGLGAGLFTSPNNSALMGAAPRERQGVAAAIMATARNVGMVLGVGLAGAVFTSVLQRLGDTRDALFAAGRASFVAGAVAAVLGAGVSLIRGAVPVRGPDARRASAAARP